MELFRALAVLAEPPTQNSGKIAEALELPALPDITEHTELFGFQLYPYASVYLGNEGMLGGEALDRIAGFWRVLGQTPPSEADHLSVMLATYAQLAELEVKATDESEKAGWRTVRKAFLWEHLLSWIPVYLSKLNDIAPPFYQRWGELLRTALFSEAETLGRQALVSLHLRESDEMIDPRTGDAEEFLQSLLTPVRSGIILVRSDLTRAAKRIGLGLRIGERKFIMKSLLSQDSDGMMEWLIEETTEWKRRHSLGVDALGETAVVWENKAAAAAVLLRELKLTS